MMRIAQQRLQASRRSRALGTFLVICGWVGFVAAIALAAWALRDLSNANQFAEGAASTVSKIDIVAVAGITPALISLLVVAAGAYLRVRSLDVVGRVHGHEEEAADAAEPHDTVTA